MLDSCASFVERAGLAKLVREIDQADEESISFEWELAVISGLGRLGRVTYEPDLPGSAKVDFDFTTQTEVRVVGDVRSVSNKGYDEKNPIEQFRTEFFRRVMKKGLSVAGFELVFGGIADGKYGARRIRALVPHPREYAAVFDGSFERFLGAINASPAEIHRFILRREAWDVQIAFNPM